MRHIQRRDSPWLNCGISSITSYRTRLPWRAAHSATANPLAARKADKDTLFSEAVPLVLEFEDAAPAGDGGALAAVVAMFSKTLEKLTGNPPPADTKPVQQHSASTVDANVQAALAQATTVMQAFATQQAKDATALSELTAKFNTLQGAHDELVKKLSGTPGGNGRPAATGGDGKVLADC